MAESQYLPGFADCLQFASVDAQSNDDVIHGRHHADQLQGCPDLSGANHGEVQSVEAWCTRFHCPPPHWRGTGEVVRYASDVTERHEGHFKGQLSNPGTCMYVVHVVWLS